MFMLRYGTLAVMHPRIKNSGPKTDMGPVNSGRGQKLQTEQTKSLAWAKLLRFLINIVSVVLTTPDVRLNQSVTISEGSFSLGESNDNEEESGSLNSEFWDEFEDWKSLMFTVPHPFTPMGRKCAQYRY